MNHLIEFKSALVALLTAVAPLNITLSGVAYVSTNDGAYFSASLTTPVVGDLVPAVSNIPSAFEFFRRFPVSNGKKYILSEVALLTFIMGVETEGSRWQLRYDVVV